MQRAGRRPGWGSAPSATLLRGCSFSPPALSVPLADGSFPIPVLSPDPLPWHPFVFSVNTKQTNKKAVHAPQACSRSEVRGQGLALSGSPGRRSPPAPPALRCTFPGGARVPRGRGWRAGPRSGREGGSGLEGPRAPGFPAGRTRWPRGGCAALGPCGPGAALDTSCMPISP